MGQANKFWLVKSEPDCFSINHLARAPRKATCWSGVRNYQARNFMREMQVGDGVLFYHSSADPPAVAGTAVVSRAAYPDHTAWDAQDDHFDPKATPENPIWQMVDIRYQRAFDTPVPIGTLRETPGLEEMELLRRGSRLSVQPVRPREFEIVLRLADELSKQASKRGAERQAPAKTSARPSRAGARKKGK